MNGNVLFVVAFTVAASIAEGYLVADGLNVRFTLLLFDDPKFRYLRERLIKRNTHKVSLECRADLAQCNSALARMNYKASKHFYALAKAVVTYALSDKTANPTGYLGSAMYCHEGTCIPDMDPPVVLGGCSKFIGCGGKEPWFVMSKINKKEKTQF